jgi:hypothetical protein
MKGKWWSIVVLVAIAALLLGVNSCGHSQQLVSIQIQPSVQTFGSSTTPVIDNAGGQVQLRALGTYIHPPVTKDITSSVTWSSNTPQMFTVSSAGLLTATGESCGGTLISATVTTGKSAGGLSSSGAIVTGLMTANVVCFTGTGGGGAGSPVLTVAFGGNGSGSVTDSAQAISCATPTPCAFLVASGTALTLTATPAGASVFGSWGGCDSANNINPCTLTLTGNRTVTATFN